MKKIIFFAVVMCAMVAGAQDFVGKSVELLDGKELQVMKATEIQRESGFRGFYADEKLRKAYKPKTVYTKAEAIEGKIFKLVSYTPSYGGKYIFKLENKQTGTIYFDYDDSDYKSFPFEVVGGVTIPEALACSWVDQKDEFIESRVAYKKWYETLPFNDMYIGLSEHGEEYFMRILISNISASSKIPSADVVLYLSDNTQITFPNLEIEAKPVMGKYDYIAKFNPTVAQVEKLKAAKIIKVQIGSQTRDIGQGNLFMLATRCLSKFKK